MTVNEAVSMAITVLHECARAQQGDHYALAFDLQDAADALTARYKPRMLDESEVECYNELGLPIFYQDRRIPRISQYALLSNFSVQDMGAAPMLAINFGWAAMRRPLGTLGKDWRAWNTKPEPEDLATPWD